VKTLAAKIFIASAFWLGASTLVQASAPVIDNISMVPNLTIQSDIGVTNQIQFSTNLIESNWVALTNILVVQSPYSFVDTSATSGPQRFYRVLAIFPPPPAAILSVTGFPSPQTAGVSGNFTVTVRDTNNAIVTGYVGTVHFDSTDPQALLPADYTFTAGDAGVHVFSATLKSAGTQSITVTDTVAGGITGAESGITVNPSAMASLNVSAASPQTAGVAFNFSVTAKDAFNNTVTSYSGTVHLTSTDGQAILPANSTLSAGTRIFSATLKTTGTQTITATDTVTGSITGTSSGIAVNSSAAASFTVTALSPQTAGAAFNFSVTAKDTFNNTVTSYSGTVHLTSTDGQAVLPVNSTLIAGVQTFSATLKTAGSQTITATDTVTGSVTGTSSSITVNPGATASYTVVPAGFAQTAGVAFNFTVTAKDAFNNTTTGYSGTAHFTSTDAQAVLPANSILTAGVGTFSVTLKTAGNQTITATDTVTGSLTGTSSSITVNPGAAASFTVAATSPQTAGVAFNVTVTAKDQFNNIATGYSGTVHFSSTDGLAVLPANSTLIAGTKTFSATTLKAAGSQTITATDTVTGSVTGTSSGITINPSAAASFSVSVTSPQTAGVAFNVTVTAKDQFNNIATGYSGTVHFTSTDAQAVLPANSTLTAGTKIFSSPTLKTAGNQTITATDTVTGSITGTSSSITVNAGAAASFTVSATSPQTASVAFNVTVTAKDQFNNIATGYSGIVHFTSTDAQAVLPANSALTAGAKTFFSSTTLKTVGTQTVAATDTVTGTLTGTSGSITVNP
jgi:hypothetical protein